jgi:NAD(P)-dependent dehydrogenase (short-subunit alcohol dehydrogenase family)
MNAQMNSNPGGAGKTERRIYHGLRATADQVLAGIDLTRKCFLVTGCNSGIGFETIRALAANGAHVIGLARSFSSAKSACDKVGRYATPIACDLADLASVDRAVREIGDLDVPIDALIANAGVAIPPTLAIRYGIEVQFLVNHIGHFFLINQLVDLVRNGSGRIVLVAGRSSITEAPRQGIMFDNLDGHRSYKPLQFYGQSKLAVTLYAKELSHRLRARRIAVNSLHPGATRGTGLYKHFAMPKRMGILAAQLFAKSASQGAATQVYLAGSPQVAGITGEYWSNCRIVSGNPLLSDRDLSRRLWRVSEQIVSARAPRGSAVTSV